MTNLNQHIADGPYFVDEKGSISNHARLVGRSYGRDATEDAVFCEVMNYPRRVLEVLRERYKTWTGLIEMHTSLGDVDSVKGAYAKQREIIVVAEACGFSREDVTG